jgi:class 3 adenylate cyclase/tetratricopeptide (TPR) repeat protein
MQCPRCQAENREGRRFCAKCAAPLAVTCPSCGFSNEPGEHFCGGCAAPLTVASRPPEPTSIPPQVYTPKHLAEKILTSKSALEGERKQVTVLFADLKGSMELLADRDPEEARKLLDPVLEHMIEAVHCYEGTVNQVMGDGIMALFGAPLAHEDHAVRACYAALRMQDTVKGYAEGVRREHGVTLRIRVGLNSGEVIVRAIGSDLHMDYTAVGQTTHLAARMEQLADPGSILLTPQTLALAEGFIQVAALGPMAVRGLPAPVEVYELTGVSAVRSRLQATATRGLSRFVGRDAEMEQLRRVLGQARQGHGQVAALVGEPGVGKSRLVFELTHSHRVEGWLVLEASSVSYGKATSYLPVIDLLKGYCGVGDRDTYRGIREKVTGKLLTLDRALEPTLPALLALLDVPVEDLQWQALDPPQRRQRTLDAIKRLVLREAQSRPLMVIFEDLHWIDSETQALLDTLVESLPTAQLLLLVSYRPEYSHAWGSKTFYTQLRLDTLPPETMGALLDGLLGSDGSLAPLKTLLAATTGGNPLFLEESVRTLVETKALLGEPAAYRLAQPIETIQVPATVQAILAARIDRLPPADKRLLETAAVIGKDVPFPLLQAIAGESAETLRRGLSHLQTAEFLYETRLFPDLEYTFKHALTHEVAYGSLLHDRRRRLHGEIVDSIERLYPDRLGEHTDRLGHHAFRAERWEAAGTYLRQAGHKAVSRSAFREAVVAYEDALAAVGHLANTREAQEQAIDLRLDLRVPLQALSRTSRLLEGDRAAEAIAWTLGDERRLGRVSSGLANTLWITGDYGAAIAAATRALDIGVRLGDAVTHGSAVVRLGAIHYTMGAYHQAVVYLRQAVELTAGERLRERLGMAGTASMFARYWLARTLTEVGAFPEAVAVAREGLDIVSLTNDVMSLVPAHSAVGYVHLCRGELAEALAPLTRAVELGKATEVVNWGSVSLGMLGLRDVRAGRLAEGVAQLERATSLVEQRGELFSVAVVEGWLGEAYLAAGDLERATRHSRASLETARAQSQRGTEAWAWRLLGKIAAETAPPAMQEAEAAYQQGLTRATELSMRPLVAHCHLGLGKLYRRTGDGAKAHEHLTTAAAMYREMDMGFWLEKTEGA